MVKVSVTINAYGTKLETKVQVALVANKDAETVFKKGVEGSSVKVSNNIATVSIKNETTEVIFAENASGVETIIASDAYKEIKNGLIADKGKTDINIDDGDTTPLGEAKVDNTPTNAAIAPGGAGFVYNNTLGKVVHFEDKNFKDFLLTMLKDYEGDIERDDMPGEYEIKLTDTSYRKNPSDTEIYESEMKKIEALTFIGWDKDYENEITVKSIKGA